MKHSSAAIFFLILILASALSSCRYSLPLIKFRTDIYTDKDTVESTPVTVKKKGYDYFRISRYGIIGDCAKYNYYNSTGALIEIRVVKISAMVCDGYAVFHSKEKQYDPATGRLLRKTYTTTKEQGWGPSKRTEKTVEYTSGKRKIAVKK